ncbi:helix-turn-helix transcriptional regulator [Paracraurococcus ruber]|uniref:ArsR family transcriptional regulator n=1 Tax=Paracraurococcus ruber TaxID=77675 RepID=A0ABS1D7B4_9PROT|nr:WYL domain-containing protein [Paracraurococcus ruber]MBK1662786.1 ArsR family transcriptional regulator [Paracraurococcus ruber]TDG04989.1 WYL domain-containing protein [Paracraurococcus ruber]
MKVRARQDAILRALRRTATATVAELAAEVGASRRTVLRDIGALRDQGFVIQSEPGPGGGVRLDPRSVQAAAPLTVVEVFALVVSVTSMRMSKAFPFCGLADSGLAKVERGLPPAKVADLRALLECLHVGRLSPRQTLADMGPMDPALLPAFETAFLERRPMRFRYRDAKGAETSREVEPQAMLILPPLWYLVAWDPRRCGFRHFRMDRIGRPDVVADASFRRRRVPFADDVCPFGEVAS